MAECGGAGCGWDGLAAHQLADPATQKHWDECMEQPYYNRRNASGAWIQGWYDNRTSLVKKYERAKQAGLQGVGVWGLWYGTLPRGAPLWHSLAESFSPAHQAEDQPLVTRVHGWKTDDIRAEPLGDDRDGTRAAALQHAVVAAADGSTIELSGTYNFSTTSFLIEGKVGLTLSSKKGAAVAMFLFGYKDRHSDAVAGSVHPGVNITSSERVSILGAAIDYSPKAPALFCNSRAPPAPSGQARLVHGNASVNEMLDGQRLWCGKKAGDKCGFGSFACPSAAACQAACAGNATCLGATWTHPPGPACFMLSALDYTDSERGFSSWSRVPVHSTSPQACPSASGPGITLHMFNCSDTLVEDLTIHAAPYMAITSFNGDGGHVLRRVAFVPNEEGQLFVAERDGVHESDVRRGITLEDSTVGYLNDDFMNIHSTMLVVLRCDSTRCLLINPHVEGGAVLDTTYAMNSVLQGARAGDTMSFFPLLTTAAPKPSSLAPLVDRAVMQTIARERDAAVLQEAAEFAMALFNKKSNGVMHFAGGGHVVDVWSVDFAFALSATIPNASLVSVNELGSAGARFVNNSFTNTTCSARWKSSNAVIANNSWRNAGHNLEITYLQSWLEGPALISNISISGNRFHYGAGVNPIHPNPIDTSAILEEDNLFLSAESAELVTRIHGRSNTPGKTDDSHAEPQPSRLSGVAVLGTPKWLPTKAEPFERYVQVQLEHSDVEATRGVYDFSLLAAQLQRLDEAEKSDPGLRAIVKLQTNSKPQWVYDVVPSTSQVWSAENWDNRTAMYWHPTYIELYLALVAAFARYTQTDPLASKYIDFTRQSWCAIGEEGIGIPGTPAAVVALHNGSAWDVPAGCTESCHPPPDWSADGDLVYQRRVLQRYNESYGQSALTTTAPRLLVRTNTPTDLIADYRAQFVQGRYGWFHTGAGMYETQCFNQSQRYENFRRDCLPLGSTTVCFAEMCGVGKLIPTANQRHGVVYSNAEVSYWIALSNMDSGVSISGMHAASVLNPQARTPELTARLSWAAGYMGRHASLQSAPGAWAAFRAEDDAGPDSDSPGRRDFTFLMAIKSVVSAPVERQCGDSGAGFGAWCRIIRGSGAIHLASADGLFGSSVTLRLVYLPSTAGAGAGCVLQLWYVSAATHSGALGLSVPTFATASARWVEATANVTDVAFGGKGPHGSDVWLALAGGNSCEARVHMVEVRKSPNHRPNV